MTETAERFQVTLQVLDAMRQSELDERWMQEHPEELEPYRGQWVVVYKQRVIAYSPDGREAARAAPAGQYPGSTMFYVPTREEADAVRIL